MNSVARAAVRETIRSGRALVRRARTEADWHRSRPRRADVAVFHEFVAPPYGGGNQFLLALVGELERRGLTVEANRISGGTPACLVNSFNFDASRLRRFAARGARIVHRVDGPVSATHSMAEFLSLLSGLSAQQRACVALRYVGEYTAPEIGDLLGTSAGTVRVQLNRAHAVLRESITESEHA